MSHVDYERDELLFVNMATYEVSLPPETCLRRSWSTCRPQPTCCRAYIYMNTPNFENVGKEACRG